MICLEFYGVLGEIAGRPAMNYPLAQTERLTAVLERLATEMPDLANYLPGVACAVNDEIVPRNGMIAPGTTLALLPPVSGG